MVKTSGVVSFARLKALGVCACLGLLVVPVIGCSSSSSSDGSNAGAGAVLGNAGSSGATGNGSSGATGNGSSGATGNGSSGATGNGSSGATGNGSMDSPTECKALYAALCHQIYACVPADQIAQDPTDLGTSEAECSSMNAAGCDDPTVTPCGTGLTYSGTQAATCVGAVQALSCADFMTVANSPSGLPTECDTVCQ